MSRVRTLLLLTVFLALWANPTVYGEVLPLTPGLTYVELETVPDGMTAAELFADTDLPHGEAWATAPRLVQADAAADKKPQGVWHAPDGWEGDLKKIAPGGYWLVLPPESYSHRLTLPDGVTAKAGQAFAQYQPATGWTISHGANGTLEVKHGPLPQSSGSYSISDTVKTRWSASSSVAVQDAPGAASGGWVRVDLGGWGGEFSGDAIVPMPTGDHVMVPTLPDLRKPPWEK